MSAEPALGTSICLLRSVNIRFLTSELTCMAMLSQDVLISLQSSFLATNARRDVLRPACLVYLQLARWDLLLISGVGACRIGILSQPKLLEAHLHPESLLLSAKGSLRS